MKLLDTRLAFYPFHYQWAYDFYNNQQRAHWLPDEINLSADINDWKLNLTDSERHVIGSTLKSFTQTEVLIGNYWTNKVCKWFKHPEIQMMGQTYGAFEAIHADSYSRLNITLGLDDFTAFSQDPIVKAKLDRLIGVSGKSKKDIATSLATFSAFTEGVSLFSSFAILLNFSRFNKMKGMGQIISFSIRDESQHSEAGCKLFNTFVQEYPEVWIDDVKREIYDAARLTIALEDNFIDSAFNLGHIEGIDPVCLKQYMRHRCNVKLNDIGLKTNWRTVDKGAVRSITEWFDIMSSGVELQDFFAQRPTSYTKGNIDWSKMYD